MKKYSLYFLPLVIIVMTSSILSDNGKAGKTGSTGELTCRDCHGDFAANAAGGSIAISNTGMTNWQYVPGQTYPITVTIARTGMSLFGLGVECLTATNTNAGTFIITNTASTQLKSATVSGVNRVNVVHQLNGGASTNSKAFTFNWTAPATGTGTVKFYFAGIAGNNDGNESGDYVYNSVQIATELPCAAPATPGSIKGAASNNCGISTKTYSITAVPTATSYVWRTDITGATINGQTGNVTTTVPNVSLTFPSNFTNAKIYVKAQNSCGASIEKSKTLSSKPAVPTAITGPVAPFKNTGNLSYSISPVAGATSYSWTVPATLMTLSSGQGSTGILAATKATTGPCTIKVGSTNACGTSGKKSLVVNIASCIREYEFVNNGFYFIEVPKKIDIFTMDGRLTRTIDHPSTEMSIADLPSGIYLVSMQYDDHITTKKIMAGGQ